MQIATAIISVILTFVFTGIVANWLVQRWQYRNWLRQQQFLGQEKDYQALKELFDEITRLSGRRLSRMFRLLAIINRKDDELVRSRLKEYDEALSEWNEKLNSLYVKLTMYANYSMTSRLEWEVQSAFATQGSKLEALVRKRLDGQPLQSDEIIALRERLNSLQGVLFDFNRDMLKRVERQQDKTYHGVEVPFNDDNLYLFPTWQLFKALFVARVETLSIIRTASDLRGPSGSRH